MDSIFSNGEKMLREAFDYASRRINYRRGDKTLAANIPAKLGKTVFRYTTPHGMAIRTEQRDFICRFDDIGIEPITGDEIVYNGEIFVVCAPNNEPCWKWHTRATRAEIRIHTKNASAE